MNIKTINKQKFQLILENKDRINWRRELDIINDIEPSSLIEILIPYIKQAPDSYASFLEDVWLKFSSEDSHQTFLWVLFQEINDINAMWFTQFLTKVLRNESNYILEEIFNLIPLNSKSDLISKDSALIQALKNDSNIELQFLTNLFLIQENLIEFIPEDLIIFFDQVSEEHQLQLIPFLFDHKNQKIVDFIRKKLLIKYESSEKTLLSFLLNSFYDPEVYYSSIKDLLNKIVAIIDDFSIKAIILELIQPSVANYTWNQKIIEYYLTHSEIKWKIFLIDNIGEFLSDLPYTILRMLIKTFESSSLDVQLALSKLPSPYWINESFIELMLKSENENVLKSVILNLAQIYYKLNSKLCNKIYEITTSYKILKPLWGYIVGYNQAFNEIYRKDVDVYLGESDEISQLFMYTAQGLIESDWNSVPDKYKNLISRNVDKWPILFQNRIKEVLLRKQYDLDPLGTKILLKLQNNSSLIDVDEIKFI